MPCVGSILESELGSVVTAFRLLQWYHKPHLLVYARLDRIGASSNGQSTRSGLENQYVKFRVRLFHRLCFVSRKVCEHL